MATKKLTLTVDESVIDRAHAYSAMHRTSISRLVTEYLRGLGHGGETNVDGYTPTVRRLLGVIPSTVRVDDYRHHLDAKYGRGE